MAEFTQTIPSSEQEGVSRTTIINFTILGSAQINTLSATISGISAISNGVFVNSYTGNIAAGVGKYVVGIYPKSPFLPRASKIDIHLEINDGVELITYDYSFYTSGYNAQEEETQEALPSRACDQDRPFFTPTDLGLRLAKDLGIGTEVELEWKEAYPHDENNVVFYNVYVSTERSEVFNNDPDFLASDMGAVIGGLRPGDTYFFGVRVAEFNPSQVALDGRPQYGVDLYKYVPTVLVSNIDSSTTFIPADTDGFPNFGILLIDDELIYYTSKQHTPSGFIVGSRGLSNSYAEEHSADAIIRLYRGKEDANTNIVQATPSFQKPELALTYVLGDGYGNDGYRDGYDGYAFSDGYLRLKQEPFDDITVSGKNNDNSGDFAPFDYCGTYRALSPASFMQGQCRGSYFGGAQVRIDDEGNRHLVKVSDIRTHMLQREELLLETTGEPFVLLRRQWTGARCPCFMMRREHADARCPLCYSTGFISGYYQFFNPRRSDRRILVRVNPTADDTNIVDRGGFEPMYEPQAWTMAFPAIKDRDVLVRFNPDNTEEFRYEILDVTRVRATFAQTGAQQFRMKRFPKTDIIYQYPAVRDVSPRPESAETSSVSAPGINLHSHQFVVPENVNILQYKGATLVSEGHNHLIYNGSVQPALGHTHSLPTNL